jgi:tRNA U34 2-thiouridine synthase MnmA/TrmU
LVYSERQKHGKCMHENHLTSPSDAQDIINIHHEFKVNLQTYFWFKPFIPHFYI